ncbi:hypothetical protein [Bacteroides nordii]|uniref:hypothetical protein n=1 Tax=Bacteroides nordii TaxID=291645 RepID=UPI0018A049EE|nr:hypothetical protein [Bacteroides nordii]
MKKRHHSLVKLSWALVAISIGPVCAQNAETNILQSTYISQPTLWMGPTLWDSGFAVEMEINSLGKYRTEEATIKSILKHKVGEYESKLPNIKAAEWGYTVVALATGKTDGSGRVINNIYLDNKSRIKTREEALTKIMEFVKQQYGYQDGDTWQTIGEGNPWYSMNGHHCWHHYAGAEGADVLSSEIGENIHGYQLHIAMNRGAAKQYNRPWCIDFSSWHRGKILDYSTHGVWEGGSGVNCGHSISLVERSMLMSYMAGADAVIAEAGGTISFYEQETADGTYDLTPYGEVFQHLTAFAKEYQVGITYTPTAVLLNRYHGMDRRSIKKGDRQAFRKFAYDDADKRTYTLIEKLWPGTFAVEDNGEEIGTMVNSVFADQVDFFLQDAPLPLLKTYKVVILSGDVKLTETELSNLMSYAETGGTVLVNADNFSQFGLGTVTEEVVKKESGQGKIIGYKDTALDNVLTEYVKLDVPFTFSETVERLVNVKDGTYYVTVINNDGITKNAWGSPSVDSSKAKTLTVTYTGNAPLSKIQEIWRDKTVTVNGNSATLTLDPGEAAVLEFSQKTVTGLTLTEEQPFRISVQDGCLQINGCGNSPVTVSNLSGQVYYHTAKASENTEIRIPYPGIYIVKCRNKSRKVYAY